MSDTQSEPASDAMQEYPPLIFTPLVALVSAATGFYFAQKGTPGDFRIKGRKKG